MSARAFALLVLALLAPSIARGEGRADAAARRVEPALRADLQQAGLAWGAPLFLRIFKLERTLEVWIRTDDRYVLFRSYPICTFSGMLGPKLREGDGQAPEGFYRVTRTRMNPWSSYHLSFDLGYPNAYDRQHGRSGSLLMVHGDCVSIGCYAMGDAAIEEIYTLMDAAFAAGQREVDVHAFPFRFDREDVAARLAHREWGDFWGELRAGWDAFERDRLPPAVRAVEGRYRVESNPR